jgi:hypothetical protein
MGVPNMIMKRKKESKDMAMTSARKVKKERFKNASFRKAYDAIIKRLFH